MRCTTGLSLLIVLGMIFAATAEPPQLPVDQEMAFDLPTFDSSHIKTERAGLFVSPDELAFAKQNIATNSAAKQILDTYLEEMDELLSLTLEPLDESWWQEDKDKPWEQTYPRVFEKTWIEPGQYAKAASKLSLAWLLTDDDRYADKAVACMMHLSEYSYEPVHFDTGMNYSAWSISLLQAYDALLKHLSSEQRRAMDDCFTRLGRAVIKNDTYWLHYQIGGRINNHLAWHKTMLGLLGLFYDRPQLEEYCLHGPRGLLSLLTDGVLDDGLWLESSLNYHFAAIPPMMVFGQAQRHAGREATLLDMTAPNSRTLKQTFDAMLYVLAPNGLIPPIGDTYGYHRKLSDIGLYELGWQVWRDPYHAWLLSHAEKRTVTSLFSPPLPDNPSSPPIATLLRPEHGYAFLRSHTNEQYWLQDATMAMLTYDRSSVHANADKLSLMIFRKDHMLVSDVEGRTTTQSHSFSSQIQGQLNRGALSQNTVMIDGKDQRLNPKQLRLVEFRDLPGERRATAADETGMLYEGVKQSRTIVLADDYVLDVFQVDCGDTERQIDWIAHILNENAMPTPATKTLLDKGKPFDLPTTGPWRWLRDAVNVDHTSGQQYSWREGDGYLGLTMLTKPDRFIVCGYPASDAEDAGTIPMVIARVHAKQAVFAALWFTTPDAANAVVTQESRQDDSLVFKITHPKQIRYYHVPALDRLP